MQEDLNNYHKELMIKEIMDAEVPIYKDKDSTKKLTKETKIIFSTNNPTQKMLVAVSYYGKDASILKGEL